MNQQMKVSPTKFNLVVLFLFFLTLILGANGTCPSICFCYLNFGGYKIINCAKQNLTKFPEGISQNVENLDLSRNVLTTISSNIYFLKELKILNLANNELTILPIYFSNLHKLEKINLSNNLFKDMTALTAIKLLPDIEELILSNNPISSLDHLEVNALKTLCVDDCHITEFKATSLTDLPSLKILNMSRNPLKHVQKPVSKSLLVLDLSSCDLRDLNSDVFQGLPELLTLLLANNSQLIHSTRSKTLTHNNLKVLDISQCNQDRPGTHGLPQLTHAKLSKNKIQMLPNGVFSRNGKLKNLLLDGNEITRVEDRSFAYLQNLRKLDLSTNGLESIQWSAFKDLTSLKVSNLSNNALRDIPNLTMFAEVIDLSNNLLHELSQNELGKFTNVVDLQLSNNVFQEFPPELKSNTLEVLSFKQNEIHRIDQDSLTGFPALKVIDLSGNRLVRSPGAELYRKNPNLEQVFLEDNPWMCNCQQLRSTFMFVSNLTDNPPTSSLICEAPKNVSGDSWETACHSEWTSNANQNQTYVLILISVVIFVIIFGVIVSIRHTFKMKRLESDQQREAREEIRERLRLLQRRNQHLEEELISYTAEPRIHPLELIGPPSYEEAVHVARMTNSLDTLHRIAVSDSPLNQVLGSADNLRSKRRRAQRPRKRSQSAENLTRREVRRDFRVRQKDRVVRKSINRSDDGSQSASEAIKVENDETVIRVDSSFGNRNRPPTPSSRRRRSQPPPANGTSTDDEDSDTRDVTTVTISVRNLRREPRSGRSNNQDNVES